MSENDFFPLSSRIIYVPREGAEQPWHIVWRKSVAADTRISLLYIAGKPEPMAMLLSASSNQAALYKIHLHLVTPPIGGKVSDLPVPSKPIMEELFKRNMNDLLSGHPAHDATMPNKNILLPVDTSADLACSSAHPWIAQVGWDCGWRVQKGRLYHNMVISWWQENDVRYVNISLFAAVLLGL